jgi:hypothetical protein
LDAGAVPHRRHRALRPEGSWTNLPDASINGTGTIAVYGDPYNVGARLDCIIWRVEGEFDIAQFAQQPVGDLADSADLQPGEAIATVMLRRSRSSAISTSACRPRHISAAASVPHSKPPNDPLSAPALPHHGPIVALAAYQGVAGIAGWPARTFSIIAMSGRSGRTFNGTGGVTAKTS